MRRGQGVALGTRDGDGGLLQRGLHLAYLTSTHYNTHIPHDHASHRRKHHPHHAASPRGPTHVPLTPQQHTTACPNLGQTRQRRTPHTDGARRRRLRCLRTGPPTPLRSNTTPTTRIPQRQPTGQRSFFHRESTSTHASTSQHCRGRSARLPRPRAEIRRGGGDWADSASDFDADCWCMWGRFGTMGRQPVVTLLLARQRDGLADWNVVRCRGTGFRAHDSEDGVSVWRQHLVFTRRPRPPCTVRTSIRGRSPSSRPLATHADHPHLHISTSETAAPRHIHRIAPPTCYDSPTSHALSCPFYTLSHGSHSPKLRRPTSRRNDPHMALGTTR